MTTPLVFDVPMPPRLTNSEKGRSRHWRALKAEKEAYWQQLDLLVYARRVPRIPPTPYPLVQIASVMHLGGAMDDDNAMARHKWLLDWLRRTGYIAGDGRRHLRWVGLPEQVVKRTGQYRIVLTLTPIQER